MYPTVHLPIKDSNAFVMTLYAIRSAISRIHPEWPQAEIAHHWLIRAGKRVLRITFYSVSERKEYCFDSADEFRPALNSINDQRVKLDFDFLEISLNGELVLLDAKTLRRIAPTEEYIYHRLHQRDEPAAVAIRSWQDRAGQN